jgi:hypothetical protein
MNKTMQLIYSNHALQRALERGVKALPVTLQDAKVEYQVDGRKTIYSWSNGLCLAVIDGEAWVKTVWLKETKKAA